MDPSTSEVVAIIGALAAAIFSPLFGLATLYINQKFSAEVLALKARVSACEERHAALDAEKAK